MIFGSMNKRHGLFVLGLIVLLAGGLLAAVGFNEWMYWSIGFVMCVVGVGLMRVSKVQDLTEPHSVGSATASAMVRQRPGRVVWALGAASALAVAISLAALYIDALDGYRWAWPVYAFVGCALIGTLVWSYLFAKMGWFV